MGRSLHLSPDDYAYHQYLLAQFQELEFAKQHWFRYLAVKYDLEPEEVIRPDGTIERQPSSDKAAAYSQS